MKKGAIIYILIGIAMANLVLWSSVATIRIYQIGHLSIAAVQRLSTLLDEVPKYLLLIVSSYAPLIIAAFVNGSRKPPGYSIKTIVGKNCITTKYEYNINSKQYELIN